MIRGFIAGAFDVIHPGYIYMFQEIKKHCDYLIVGLHKDPESNGKLKPILSVEERILILKSICYVDQVFEYKGEKELVDLLNTIKVDIRFLGEDYKDKSITKGDLDVPIKYLSRDHQWSTTKFKTLIYEQLHGKDLQ